MAGKKAPKSKPDVVTNKSGEGVTLGKNDELSLGPIKINGDLTMTLDAILTLTGTVWVTGNIYLKNDEITRSLEGSSLVNFMAITNTIFDRYDVVRESDPAELETLYRYESFLDTNTDKLITMLSRFGDLGDDSVSHIFLTNLDN